jgi:uncharacterized RDD family membrane protein YckC
MAMIIRFLNLFFTLYIYCILLARFNLAFKSLQLSSFLFKNIFISTYLRAVKCGISVAIIVSFIFFDKKNRTLHDKIGKTYVVKKDSLEDYYT